MFLVDSSRHFSEWSVTRLSSIIETTNNLLNQDTDQTGLETRTRSQGQMLPRPVAAPDLGFS